MPGRPLPRCPRTTGAAGWALRVATAACVVWLAGCATPPPPMAHTAQWPPGLSPAPEAGHPVTGRAASLTPPGQHTPAYTEREYRFSGLAHRFTPAQTWLNDGQWAVMPSQAPEPFATRLLVRRPADPRHFNGTVLVEWLNTTAGFDLDAGWLLGRRELMREGYAWVGVSAQREGLMGTQAADPGRYDGAHIDSNDLSWDIFTQAAQAVLSARAEVLGSTRPPQLLATGYSQSAVWLQTYINAIAPLSKLFQGFLLHGAAPAAMWPATHDGVIFKPMMRRDPPAPVLQLQTEMEAMVSWSLSDTVDTPWHRYWEIAGAAHLPEQLQGPLKEIAPGAFLSGPHGCIKPLNNLPVERVFHAALEALRRWSRDGVPPVTVPRLTRNALGFVKNDPLGNALGGFRLPEIEAPTAKYGMYSNVSNSALAVNHMYLCMAGGDRQPLNGRELRALYADHAHYVARYRAAADALVTQGLMRPADRDEGLAQAQAADVP